MATSVTITDTPLKVVEATNEEAAKGLNNGEFVYCKEAGKSGKIFHNGVQYGGDEPFETGTGQADVAVGGIYEGYDMEGKELKDVIDDLVHPTFAPFFVDASSSMALKQGGSTVSSGTYREVGTSVPAQADYEFSNSKAYTSHGETYAMFGDKRVFSGRPYKGKNSNDEDISGDLIVQGSYLFLKVGNVYYSFDATTGKFIVAENDSQKNPAISDKVYGGAPTSTASVDSTNTTIVTDGSGVGFGEQVTSIGKLVVKGSTTFADGTADVLDNKWNNVAKTGGTSKDTRLNIAKATDTSHTVAVNGQYKVKAITKSTSSHTLNFRYAVYATTVASTLTKQPIRVDSAPSGVPASYKITGAEWMVFTLKKGTTQIALPTRYLTGTKRFNNATTYYQVFENNLGWNAKNDWSIGSTVNKKLGDNATDEEYTIIQRDSALTADMECAIVFYPKN